MEKSYKNRCMLPEKYNHLHIYKQKKNIIKQSEKYVLKN